MRSLVAAAIQCVLGFTLLLRIVVLVLALLLSGVISHHRHSWQCCW
jgi:hypothetical protein